MESLKQAPGKEEKEQLLSWGRQREHQLYQLPNTRKNRVTQPQLWPLTWAVTPLPCVISRSQTVPIMDHSNNSFFSLK